MYEQLSLFENEETPMTVTLDDDTTEITNERITEILDTLCRDFEDASQKRLDVAVFNYLMGYGLPERPADVRHFIHQLTAVMFGWAVGHGYITFTDKALATDEEKAARPEPVHSAFEEVDESEGLVIQGNFGQYL